MMVRTRFAPSPTGYLHIGGVRTALFSWLFAKQHQGQFILRIEDTDLERSTVESSEIILMAMQWLGLQYDEGPFYQTKRLPHYQNAIEKLLASGHAYRCYCSKERLAKVREQQVAAKQKPRYDGHCRDHQPDDLSLPHVIRLRNPTSGVVTFDDMVYGSITVANEELDDLVLMRADGMPTYNFGVVIDDWEMNITHVIRGDDHINNTPRQINILQALGASIPHYAHLPMILGHDGQRLSKRHGAVNVLQYRDLGYLPEAVLNYLARLGWSYGDQEIFSLAEMVEKFDLNKVNKAAAAFNAEKMLWVNQQHIKSASNELLVNSVTPFLSAMNADFSQGPSLSQVVEVQRDRSKTLYEMATSSAFWFSAEVQYDPEAMQQWLTAESLPVLTLVHEKLSAISDWQKDAIHMVLNEVRETLGIKMPQLAQPLRTALVGNTHSPSIDVTIALLGKGKTLLRLERALVIIKK